MAELPLLLILFLPLWAACQSLLDMSTVGQNFAENEGHGASVRPNLVIF